MIDIYYVFILIVYKWYANYAFHMNEWSPEMNISPKSYIPSCIKKMLNIVYGLSYFDLKNYTLKPKLNF